MVYESALSFGKNASTINEAYAKMYSRGKVKPVNESEDEPTEEELMLGGDLSDAQKNYIRNFDADKEYEEYLRGEKRRREREREEANDEVASGESDQDNISGVDADEDEDTRSFMSSFNSREDRDSSRGGDDDFIFSTSRYADTRLHKYPEWLREAARKAGHVLPDDDDVPSTYQGHGAKRIDTVASAAPSRVAAKTAEEEYGDEGTPWDNLYDNIVVAHPEVFNEERYDMTELPKHKKEFLELWQKYFMKGVDQVRSAERAFEEIPGCECKVKEEPVSYDDFVGDIDTEDVEDDTSTSFKSVFDDMKGYGIVVKSYERDFSPGARNMKYMVRYITPAEFKGKDFETLDEAKNALRDFMVGLVGDPSDVCIGVIIDNELSKKIFNGSGEEDITDENGNVVYWTSGPLKGKPKKRKIKSTVYTISSSDKENTDRSIAYETSNWKGKPEPCNEYLQ